VVLALVLVGGQNATNGHTQQLTETQTTATPGASRILRDPALLYSTGDQRVSLMAALEYLADSAPEPLEPEAEVAAATATATEAVATPSPTQAPPTRTPEPVTQSQSASVAAVGALISGHATSYGASYNGHSMGCGGVYSSNDITILAVSPARYREWPCGARVQVCGPAGCIVVTRQDACPGCYANLVDLSEAGNAAVCGSPPHTCRVTLQLVGAP
jgi:hypothetical protein